jgi:predicted dehydrogenase
LKADRRVQVLGVVDRHPERARGVAQAHGLRDSGGSFDEPWAAGARCLVVGAPPLAHAGLIGEAVGRGWHCLSEKPLALPAAAAANLVEAARSANLVLAVVHNFQFSRSGARLFGLVESGKLGAIRSVHAIQLSNPNRRLPHWYRELPGGLFLDEAPHLLYLLRRLLGRLEIRTVDARTVGAEIRNLSATFEHDSIWATLSMDFDASVSEWQLVVVGDRATAALDLFRDLLVVVSDDGYHRARDILRTSLVTTARHLAGVAGSGARHYSGRLDYGNGEVVRRFVDAVEGRTDRVRWMTGEDGLAVVACQEEILARLGIAPPA